jgi:hypothetical protein
MRTAVYYADGAFSYTELAATIGEMLVLTKGRLHRPTTLDFLSMFRPCIGVTTGALAEAVSHAYICTLTLNPTLKRNTRSFATLAHRSEHKPPSTYPHPTQYHNHFAVLKNHSPQLSTYPSRFCTPTRSPGFFIHEPKTNHGRNPQMLVLALVARSTRFESQAVSAAASVCLASALEAVGMAHAAGADISTVQALTDAEVLPGLEWTGLSAAQTRAAALAL